MFPPFLFFLQFQSYNYYLDDENLLLIWAISMYDYGKDMDPYIYLMKL